MKWGHDPRTLLLSALLLDWLGQLLILAGIATSLGWLVFPVNAFPQLEVQGLWLIFCLLLYPLLGWLFGSYTVLRWRRLSFPLLLQRLFITTVVTLMVVAVARWLVNPSEEVWLVYRRVQVVWLGALTAWSLLMRISLRRGFLLPDAPRLMLLASDKEIDPILQAWVRVEPRQLLEPILPLALEQLLDDGVAPLLVALSPKCRCDPSLSRLIERLEMQDPRLVLIISVISLFEQQQERLPPALLADFLVSYEELPWAAPFSVQAQLKRLADLLVAVALLLLTAPLLGWQPYWSKTKGLCSTPSSAAAGWVGLSKFSNCVRCAKSPRMLSRPGPNLVISASPWWACGCVACVLMNCPSCSMSLMAR